MAPASPRSSAAGDGAAFAACTSPQAYSGLADGGHTFEVRAIDAAGNVDQTPASSTWTVDTTAPTVTIDSGPSGLTNDPTPTFTFSSEAGASFECSIDTGTPSYGPCSGPGTHTPSSPLADGPYTFRVRATDAATNSATEAQGFTLDTSAPPPPQLTATIPASPANQNSPKVVGTAPAGSTVNLYTTVGCSGSPIATTTAAELEAGVTVSVPDDTTTRFRATVTDEAANLSACSSPLTYVEDSTPPQTQIDSSPPAQSGASSANFSFSGSDTGGSGVTSFECRRDGGAFTACTSPQAYSGLADGGHTFEVRAIDQAGNTDATPASSTWTVDTTAPTTSIDSGPSGLTNNANASFGFSGSDSGGSGIASFQCSRDGAAFAACTSPQAYSSLSDGVPHLRSPGDRRRPGTSTQTPGELHLDRRHHRADDLDRLRPVGPDEQLQPPTSASRAPTPVAPAWRPSSAGSTRRRRRDWRACASPKSLVLAQRRVPHLRSPGDRRRPGTSTRRPASSTWTVDTTAPTTSIDSGPSGLTNNANASFGFSGSDTGGSGIASFQCSRDGAAFAACTSPQAYSGSADGGHTFEVRAIDAAGNVDQTPASSTWTVDTTAPTIIDRLRPLGPDQRSDAYLHLQLRGGGELRMLDRHRHAQLRAMLGTRNPHTVLAAGRRPIHVPGAGDGCRDQFRDRRPKASRSTRPRHRPPADGDDPGFARKRELTKDGRVGSGGIHGAPLHHRRLFGLSSRDGDRRGTRSRRDGLGPGRLDDQVPSHGHRRSCESLRLLLASDVCRGLDTPQTQIDSTRPDRLLRQLLRHRAGSSSSQPIDAPRTLSFSGSDTGESG